MFQVGGLVDVWYTLHVALSELLSVSENICHNTTIMLLHLFNAPDNK